MCDKWFDEFFKNVGLLPIYELLVSIYRKFDLMHKFSSHQGFLMRLLELVLEAEEDHGGLASFLEYFEEAPDEDLYVQVRRENAVSVLTIHKAKGLEFEVVLVPFLSMDIKVGAGRTHDKSYIVSGTQEDGFSLLRLKKTYNGFSQQLAELYKQEYKKSLLDELNSIYVVLTRAKQELYVFVCERNGRGFNPARLLIPDELIESGQRTQESQKKKKEEVEEALIKIPPSRQENWIHLLREEFVQMISVERCRARQRGDLLHEIFSYLIDLRNQDVNKIVKEVCEKVAFRHNLRDCPGDLEDVVKKLLSKETIMAFFDIEGAAFYTEMEIVDKSGYLRRLDRVVIENEKISIIDYKSSHEERALHQKQIKEYRDIMQSIYPKHLVRVYLVYFDNCEVEEVYG